MGPTDLLGLHLHNQQQNISLLIPIKIYSFHSKILDFLISGFYRNGHIRTKESWVTSISVLMVQSYLQMSLIKATLIGNFFFFFLERTRMVIWYFLIWCFFLSCPPNPFLKFQFRSLWINITKKFFVSYIAFFRSY